ncbi:hypothetical protein SHIRM173S_11633 [Streptomyces hirsutus]
MSVNSAERPALLDVVLVKAGRTKISYPAELLADDGTRVTVRAPWAGDGVRDFGFVRFEPGDVFTEHYWRDRWYAVKEVRTATGTLKGHYCDVTRPAELSAGRTAGRGSRPGPVGLGGRHRRTAAGRGRVRGERPDRGGSRGRGRRGGRPRRTGRPGPRGRARCTTRVRVRVGPAP